MRTGGLLHNKTLRALGVFGGHLLPSPQKRLDNAINVAWTPRNELWIHSAEGRMRYRLHEDVFVEATAPDA